MNKPLLFLTVLMRNVSCTGKPHSETQNNITATHLLTKTCVLLIGLLVAFETLHAQVVVEVVDNDSVETNDELHASIIDFLSTVAFESCVDIGSGDLALILKIADRYPEAKFVLEDIDAGVCNRSAMHSKIEELNLLNVDTNKLYIHIGEVQSTGLPANQFDLVLMSGILHELANNDSIFVDVRRILKPHGSIIISDAFYAFAPDPHPGCQHRFMTHEELEDLLAHRELSMLKEWRRVGIRSKSNGPYQSRMIQCAFK